ncbi:MAG: dihydrodipicolinate synthase family protein [Verrucomicrobia bacterium]|nr:dihydrodipicolinate synthase family protein [Verrucomicrobiota bacterium]
MKPYWSGVFPALTTQLKKDQSLDLPATARHIETIIKSGVSGLVMCGSLGENQTLDPDEKLAVVRCAVETAKGRIPVLSGVAESSTAAAIRYLRDVEKLGASGVMLMPPMSYKSDPSEALTYFRTVARGGNLPIMIYNNPISYANDITPAMFAELAKEKKFVALKESSGDPRRITELRLATGNRYAVFTGVDDLILECSILGIDGWVAGSGIAFPVENQRLWELTRAGEWDKARQLYAWMQPLMKLDTSVHFVQYIKLLVQEAGLGAEWVRAPRLTITGDERKNVLKIIRDGLKSRPKLPKLRRA